MSFFSDLKLKSICRKEGRLKEFEDYKSSLKSVEEDIKRFEEYIKEAEKRFEEAKQKYPETSKEYQYAKRNLDRWKYDLYEAKLKMDYIRPNSPEDVEYRDMQGKEFEKKLQSVISPNLDLRFHGTPIYFAEQIIKSGEITSSADRHDGYISSTDLPGEISASTPQTIGRTIGFFSDIYAYVRSLPAGCIFALQPKDKEDAELGVDILHSVDFKKNPEQLFGIFTTSENIERVKGWMQDAQMNPDMVYTFEGFLREVEEKSKNIDFKMGIKTRDDKSFDEARIFNGTDMQELAKGRRSGTLKDSKKFFEEDLGGER